MRAVDTNVLVRLVTRDDPRQARAADEFVRQGAWIPHIALVEAVWVLESVYERAAGDIAVAVDMLLNHSTLTIQDADVVAAALARFRRTPALEFSDCLLLEISSRAGHVPVGTFDRRFGREAGVEVLPS